MPRLWKDRPPCKIGEDPSRSGNRELFVQKQKWKPGTGSNANSDANAEVRESPNWEKGSTKSATTHLDTGSDITVARKMWKQPGHYILHS
uniref:Uncharacterized protein n=1 Tax=Anopheles dirus TaxID=7168 RepID=A0A182ND87_9DIPT